MIIRSINPSTNQLLQEFRSTTCQEVDAAVERADKAQRAWAAYSFQERSTALLRLKATIKANASALLQLITTETGKRPQDAEAELLDVIDAVDYYVGSYEEGHRPLAKVPINESAFPDTNVELQYVPLGTVGLIMPWNFPFYVPMMLAVPALLTGNSVILKPSEYSTMVALLIGDLARQSGLPQGLLQVLPGDDSTGKSLVKSSVAKVFFVGSLAGGTDVLRNAGIKPVQIELGGNSAAVVLEDADIQIAAEGVAWGATYNSGQDCAGIKRVFVVESIAERFVAQITQIVEGLRPGIDYGPYISPEAMQHAKDRIDAAIKLGATLVFGGDILVQDSLERGNWLRPSILVIPHQDLDIVRDELFGNCIPIMVVKDDQAAIKAANETHFGLSAAIFTTNIERARTLAAALDCGMVFINDPFIAFPGWDHWTGWKSSGFGTPESRLLQFVKKKVISINTSTVKRSFWYPYPG